MALMLLRFFLVIVASSLVTATSGGKSMTPPSTGNEWMSLSKGIEFQPANAHETSTEHQQRALRHAQKRFLADESQQATQQQLSYVDSKETYYDAYAQAWRYVGFYTDCGPIQDDHRRKKRRNRNLNEDEEEPCAKYLLWAAVRDINFWAGCADQLMRSLMSIRHLHPTPF